ncbi:MAG: aminotransferase class V-fold PLP-dependent enzyme [Armatimonadetes bacterium]|nr:aminotransferase class V-fold PLP-dependent enzyme [Armatimonadota bacterium]
MIYLDNAATAYPKAPGVAQAMADCIEHAAGGPGRSFGAFGEGPARIVFETRQALADLFGWPDPTDIVLTSGATYSLNLALQGLLRPGDHVVTTGLEHNAVSRPLTHLRAQGIQITRVACPGGLSPEPGAFREALRSTTRLIAVVHASNVSGALLPLTEISAIAREADVPLLVDASQTAGGVPISLADGGPHLLAFTGHKGLLGPPGTGGLFIDPSLDVQPLCRGGTGSRSFSDEQPTDRPDRFESGTPNVPGIAGLGVGVRFVAQRGVTDIRAHETRLIDRLLSELGAVPNVSIYGPRAAEERVGLVSLNVGDVDPAEVGLRLEREYGIITRCGFHCAPWAHESQGTLDRGAVRLSVSPLTTEEEIEQAARAIREIAAHAG